MDELDVVFCARAGYCVCTVLVDKKSVIKRRDHA